MRSSSFVASRMIMIALVAVAAVCAIAVAGQDIGVTPRLVGGPSVWGRCVDYIAHAGTAVNFDGPTSTLFTGSAGVAPGTSITGSVIIKDGSKDINNAAAIACANDKIDTYNYLHGLTCPPSNHLDSPDLSDRRLLPGVWCFTNLVLSATTLTLDGGGDPNAEWVFQTASTLITSTGTQIILINGARAENVYFAVGSSATLGYDSSFIGQITAHVSITVGEGANFVGRMIAGAAVVFAGNDEATLPQHHTLPIPIPL